MNTEQEREMRERRLTAVLEEVAGGGAPAELAERVLARVRVEPPAQRPQRRAMLLAGIAVVVATARSRSGASGVPAQDPAPPPGDVPQLMVTTAMVRAACAPIDAPPPGDGVTRLLALVGHDRVGLVVASGVRGESEVDLAGLTWHEAVGHIAAELGAGVADFGTMVVVGIGPVVPVERLRCSVSVKEVDVRELGKVLQAKAGMTVVVAGDIAGRVTIDVEAVPARALLDVVAARLALDVVGCGSALALRRARERQVPPRLLLQLPRCAVGDAYDLWAKLTDGNLVIDPAIVGTVSVRTMSAVDRGDLLTALSAAVGADVRRHERGVIQVVPCLPLPVEVSFPAENVPGDPAVIELTDVHVTVGAPGTRDLRIGVAHAPALDMLRAVAVASGRTFVRTDTGYAFR